jgi:hypothetical protein
MVEQREMRSYRERRKGTWDYSRVRRGGAKVKRAGYFSMGFL